MKLQVWIWTSIRSAGWAPALVFALHLFLSVGLGAYLSVPQVDIPMHILGGVAIAFFFRRALEVPEAVALVGRMTELGRTLFALASVCAAALVWELAEWTSDYLGLSQMQVGLDDTMFDMLLGVLGGMAFLLVTSRFRSRAQRPSSRADAA